MGHLTSDFTKDDIETLIEAMGDWESIGMHEFQIMKVVQQSPLPPEDHEAFEYVKQVKEHFKQREKEILATRRVRQERAIFLKAKLLLVRQDMAVDQLFSMPTSIDQCLTPPTADETVPEQDAPEEGARDTLETLKTRLAQAEYYIKDLGVWNQYQHFLEEKRAEAN